MNNDEAIQLLDAELADYRQLPYADLARRIEDESVHIERRGASGAEYQVEIQFFWDGDAGGGVLVIGSIDDGGWRAFSPLSRSFIKSADGRLVGE